MSKDNLTKKAFDHVKYRYPLTVNHDYCHYLALFRYSSYAYLETAVNEVQLIDRSAIIQIDVATKSLELELKDYRENTVSLDTPEGIATLDRWIEFWCNVLRNVVKRTPFTFSNIPKLWQRKNVDKLYSINGASGESIRDYFRQLPQKFVEHELLNVGMYSRTLSLEISSSIEKTLESGFRAVCDKYGIEDPNSEDIPQFFCLEGMFRHHFGKDSLVQHLMGNVQLCPINDFALRTLRLNTTECPNPKLLIACIYSRYEPDVLDFPFDNKHFIAPETIAHALKLNKRFPYHVTKDKVTKETFQVQTRNLHIEQTLAANKNNPDIPYGLLGNCLKATFDSSQTYRLLTKYFDKEIYDYANLVFHRDEFRRYRPSYTIMGM